MSCDHCKTPEPGTPEYEALEKDENGNPKEIDFVLPTGAKGKIANITESGYCVTIEHSFTLYAKPLPPSDPNP